MIAVSKAPPYLTVQDLGRPGRRAEGIPVSGAMDGWALSIGNRLVGNSTGAAGLEWALGGGSLRFERPTTFALTGAAAEATLNGCPVQPCCTFDARPGDVLTIVRLSRGRFLYVAVIGGIDVPNVLGSRSTYLPGRIGGLEGRLVRSGDVLPVGERSSAPRREGFKVPGDLPIEYGTDPVRVVAGPQRELFGEDGWRDFLQIQYTVSDASDRVGYRLTGQALRHSAAAGIPSEPACHGAIQVPEAGHPIVLMSDGPTIGGYPKIAVVISADLPLIAQRVPGDAVRFRAISVAEAQAAWQERTRHLLALARLAAERDVTGGASGS